MADLHPDRVTGLHLNLVIVRRPEDDDPATLTAEEQRLIAAAASGARRAPATRRSRAPGRRRSATASTTHPSVWPRGSSRSSAERCGGDIERSFTKDQLLTNITVYWVTPTATSSTRLYYEMRQAGRRATPQAYIRVPTGVACYPGENSHPPRRWVEHRYNVTHWADQPRGGHFAAMEVPDIFVDDVRRSSPRFAET